MLKKSQSELMGEFFRNMAMRTVGEMMNQFNCSRVTAFRYLKEGSFLTSVNCRGQYHMSGVGIKFNRYGLYKRDGKVFSSHGNLLETITVLASSSTSGVTVSEISRIVGTNVNMQCQELFKNGILYRERYGREYCYFSGDTMKRDQQLTLKNTTMNTDLDSTLQKETFDSLREVIRILITFIAHPEFSPKSIALSLTRRGIGITTESVKAVFEKYGLAKKNS